MKGKRRSRIRSGAYVRQPCSNAARGKSAASVWKGGGGAVWPIEQFMALASSLLSDECRFGRLRLIGKGKKAAEWTNRWYG